LANRPRRPILGASPDRAETEDDVTQDGNESREETGGRAGERVPLTRGLSMKLLVLTVLFITLAEALIFLPSLANFRLSWLEERLSTAAAVGIVLVESDPESLSREVQDDVLRALGAMALAVRDEGSSRLLVAVDMPHDVDLHVDLGEASPLAEVHEALYTLFFGGARVLRVSSPLGVGEREFELVMPERDLRKAMLGYARNVALLSLILSLVTASLVFYAIDRVMIRPMRRMTRSMLAFAGAPDDPALIVKASARSDEIGVAERELAAMQGELQRLLVERRRLADLGLAVSKINHDMRNMLAAAQMMSDRLARVDDPSVQKLAPRLVRTLDRAIAYSEGVLAYGRMQEPPPARRKLRLRDLADEVFALSGPEVAARIDLVNAVAPDFEVEADPDQLLRVLSNLARNAIEAMSGDDAPGLVRRLTISAERNGGTARILVEDTGPGLPQKARENLFSAFRGSARHGGTGLGLAIAHELVRAHGGTLELVESRGGRTLFAIAIPDRPLDLDAARRRLPARGTA
jgi:signal transduction histidine kinase